MIPQWIAVLAPMVNGIQMVPQLYKTYRTKRVKDLSVYTICLLLTANILWFFHGYFIMDVSLMVSGIISVTINTTLLNMYFVYR